MPVKTRHDCNYNEIDDSCKDKLSHLPLGVEVKCIVNGIDAEESLKQNVGHPHPHP